MLNIIKTQKNKITLSFKPKQNKINLKEKLDNFNRNLANIFKHCVNLKQEQNKINLKDNS